MYQITKLPITIFLLLLIGLTAACGPTLTATPTVTLDPPSPMPTATPTPIPTATPTPTPMPPKELTICQKEEPNTLFIYGKPSRAALNVLEAIYDGPIDTLTYQFQPVILESLPSLDNGDATLRTVHVEEGDRVVDVNSQAVDLLPGVVLFNADGERVPFEEGQVITTTQMVVTFTLRSDITWADGEPLTADDSRYAYELADKFEDPTLRRRRERTHSYETVDNHTLVWTGLPGYRDTFYFLNVYHPLPRHVLGEIDADQLLNTEMAHRKPLGWGPFVVEEWVEGNHITMVRNPNYFRASEGLPHLDRVTFRFVSGLEQALDDLAEGHCDFITQRVIAGADMNPLLEAADVGRVQLISSTSSEWEHMDFSIDSSQWSGQTDFFSDVTIRQAVAHCIDRERIAHEAFSYSGTTVADSYVAPEHPLYASENLHHWAYDPLSGQALLEEAGWLDEDEDGIREAHGVSGIVSGTPFSVTLFTTEEDIARERTANILMENLEACGIGVAVDYLPPEVFYADGPDGPIFGRQFDLALFSWLNGTGAPCELYLSTEIPTEENWWAASNNPGYASEEYDEACRAAKKALPGMEAYTTHHHAAQRIFSRDLPVLPLYFVPKLVAAHPEVSGVVLDPSEYVNLWNIEMFDVD